MNTSLLYSLLGVLELVLVVSGLAVWLWLRNRRAGERIAELESALADARVRAEAVEPVAGNEADAEPQQDYADFLGLELEASTLMLGPQTEEQAAGEGAAEDDQVRRMLAARHQFLQMELDAERMGKDPEAKRRHLVDGMEALLATLFPATEAETDAEPGTVESEPDAATLSREQQLEDQISHLKSVIDNQHEVMRDLRDLLEEKFEGSEEVQAMMHRLDDAEARAQQVQRALEAAGTAGGGLATGVSEAEGAFARHEPDADMLRDLVSSQQRTIDDLKRMLHESVADGEVAQELEEAMGKMQRANQELGMCVSVLEDENAHLRDQVEALRTQVEALQDGGGGENSGDADGVADAMADTTAGVIPAEPETDAEAEQPSATADSAAEQEAAESVSQVFEEVLAEAEVAQAELREEAAEAEAPAVDVDVDSLLDEVAGDTGDKDSQDEVDVDALLESATQSAEAAAANADASGPERAADQTTAPPSEPATGPTGEDAAGAATDAAGQPHEENTAGGGPVAPPDAVADTATEDEAIDIDALIESGGEAVTEGNTEAVSEREVALPVGSSLDLAEDAGQETDGAATEPDADDGAFDIDALIDGALEEGDDGLDADLRKAGKS